MSFLVLAGLAFCRVGAVAGAAAPTPPVTQPVSTQPSLSVDVNGLGLVDLHRGWPVIVEAVVGGAGSTLEVRLNVVDAQWKAVEWPLQRTVDQPADANGFRTVYWVMDGDKSAGLGEGAFEISIQLRRGDEVIAESVPAEVKVVAAPAGGDLPDDLRMLRVQFNSLTGHQADAEREAAEWLKAQPASTAALTTSGDLAFSAGRLQEAKQAYDQALTNELKAASKRKLKEVPQELIERQNAVLRAMVRESIKENPATTKPWPRQ